MTIVRDIPATAVPGVRMVDNPGGLRTIRDSDCSAAIWDRVLPNAVETWINGLDPNTLPCTRTVLRPCSVRQMVHRLCDEAGTPEGPERVWLEDDIAYLAQAFAELVEAPYLRLRLAAVSNNACRKFHVDAITARLICTYRGTATQYGHSIGQDDPDRVMTAQTGAAVVLRGTRWRPDPGAQVLHRSPPIEGKGETRLVLVLDPVDRLDDDG